MNSMRRRCIIIEKNFFFQPNPIPIFSIPVCALKTLIECIVKSIMELLWKWLSDAAEQSESCEKITWYFSAGGMKWWIEFQIWNFRLIQARRRTTNISSWSKLKLLRMKEVFQVSNRAKKFTWNLISSSWKCLTMSSSYFICVFFVFILSRKNCRISSSPITLERKKKHRISHIYGLTDDDMQNCVLLLANLAVNSSESNFISWKSIAFPHAVVKSHPFYSSNEW